jgi:hypothetical protein
VAVAVALGREFVGEAGMIAGSGSGSSRVGVGIGVTVG